MPITSHSLAQAVRAIPDFPKPGVIFRDISPLLNQHFRETIDLLSAQFTPNEWAEIDAIVGIESRGFILASGISYAQNKGLIIVRKPGKLPPPRLSVRYTLEYGEDELQMATNLKPQRVLIIDDVLATGGTLLGACELCTQCGHEIKGIGTLINLSGLNQFAWPNTPVRTLFTY